MTDSFTGITRYTSDMKWLRGLEYRTDWVHAQTDGTDNGNKTKRVTAQHYSAVGTGDSREVRSTRQVIYYDPGLGGNGIKDLMTYSYGSYGNVTEEYTCPGRTTDLNNACDSTGGYSRKTQRWFNSLNQTDSNAPGGYRYIVDRVKQEGVGAPDGTWPAFTYYSYDTDTAASGPSSKGQLWWVRKEESATCNATTGCSATSTSDVKMEYDATFGLPTKVTTFTAFGVSGAAQTGGRTVETQYDSALKTFVTKVIQPGGTIWEEASYDLAAFRRERPVWVRDSNDASGNDTGTLLDYDDFGRLLKVAAPGDTLTSPTTAYEYIVQSTAPKLLVKTTQRLDATRTVLSRVFRDGLGRVVLVKNPDPNGASSQTQAIATFYDSRGLNTSTTIAYAGSNNDTFARDTGVIKAMSEYDQFGQALISTRPDGTHGVSTLLNQTRTVHAVQRGAKVTVANPSFETGGGSTCSLWDSTSYTLPLNWSATRLGGTTFWNGCVKRSTEGQEARFALHLWTGQVDVRVTQAMLDQTRYHAASDRFAVTPNTVYTLSYLARGRLGTGKFRPVVKEAATSGGADLIWQAPAEVWTYPG